MLVCAQRRLLQSTDFVFESEHERSIPCKQSTTAFIPGLPTRAIHTAACNNTKRAVIVFGGDVAEDDGILLGANLRKWLQIILKSKKKRD